MVLLVIEIIAKLIDILSKQTNEIIIIYAYKN